MSFNFTELLKYSFANNTIKAYLIAVLVFIVSTIVLKIFKYTIINKLKKVFAGTKTQLDELLVEIVDKIGWPFYLFLSLYLSLKFIQLPSIVDLAMYYIILIFITFYVVRGAQDLISYVTQKIILKKQAEDKNLDTTAIDLLSRIAKGVLWSVAIILLLSNLGYDVSTLIAGLGIGGITIAFALQNILNDVFASFSIYFDKPFKIGDFIVIGDDMGVVKKIGIKTTRLQSLQGQEIIISNQELTSTRINNYRKMDKRRVVFILNLVYDLSTKKLKKAIKIVENIFSRIDLVELDRVHFKTFASSSLDFEVVYYINSADYNKYMDVQQEINFAIKEEFDRAEISFAYPTQTVLLDKS